MTEKSIEYKVGDRVRIANYHPETDDPTDLALIGETGTVVQEKLFGFVTVAADNVRTEPDEFYPEGDPEFLFYPEELEVI